MNFPFFKGVKPAIARKVIDPKGRRLIGMTKEHGQPIWAPKGHSLLLSANGGGKTTTIIRDLYEERYGQLMKETLDELLAQEAKLPETARPEALRQANRIKEIIEKGETKPFYRALDHAGYTLADHLGITETGAKNLMREVYREEYGRELYADGKAWEKEFHQPVRESARQAREAKRDQTRSRARA